ncbi:MAG: hypothetical protein ASARMPRED_005040 [Alectoria sarmentosa]|nr:MAG: hypothetical protein ASARMPRED_005040 [Alectoria sarmentosa]
MESPEGPQAEIRHIIREHLDDLKHRLTGELTEKLTERYKTYSAERTDHLQEIDDLRRKAARIEELEAENRKLNTALEEARQRHRERSKTDGLDGINEVDRSRTTLELENKTENLTVDIEEYNRVKLDLVKLERDYGKLVWARHYLETKYREQKDSLRQWKEYRNNWILKHPNKRLRHLRPRSTRASPLTTAEDCRSSSAPTPPALPEGLTPSLTGVSRSPSPHHYAPVDPKFIKLRHEQALENHSGDRESLSDETTMSHVGHNIANASDSGDVTEVTAESQGQAEPIKNKSATGGSSPIIVFERSLKRRRSVKDDAKNIRVHEDGLRHLGAGPGTLAPKGEQISSPIPAPPLLHLDGPHDSLDLDDVGGHLDTPRKRQRIAQERLRSSMMLSLTEPQDGENMLGDATESDLPRSLHDGEAESERDKQPSSPAEDLWSLRQKSVDEEKKARKDDRMARQHAHNDRVHQRLEGAERSNSIFDPPVSSPPTTNEPVQHPYTPNDSREVRQREPQLASPVILQPKDVNASVLPRTSDPFANRKRPCPPSRRDRGAAYVPVLAEDGEGLNSNSDPLKAGKKSKDDRTVLNVLVDKEPKAPATHYRLGALLTNPSPEKSLLISEESAAAVSSDQAWSKTPITRVYHSKSKDPATPRSLPTKKTELNHGPGAKSGLAGFEPVEATMDRYSKSAQAVSKRTTRTPALRKPLLVDYSPETRPEHEPLRARPVHRLGLQDFKFNPAHSNYAYHECKGVRKYVIDSGYKTAQKPGESEDEADWRLMQEYLGDNRRQLRSMPTEERSDLLIEAKVKEFANRYGCHRQAFARARDAPGLWEVDFPTTQEEAENRIAAEIVEREKVQERYWEATRPKGKWMFADE